MPVMKPYYVEHEGVDEGITAVSPAAMEVSLDDRFIYRVNFDVCVVGGPEEATRYVQVRPIRNRRKGDPEQAVYAMYPSHEEDAVECLCEAYGDPREAVPAWLESLYESGAFAR